MQLVIDIPEEFYEEVRKDPSVLAPPFLSCEKVGKIIANGKPLPNGKSILVIDTPKTCADCPCCIFTAEEKRAIGFCNTSDEDYYCKLLEGFRKYDKVDGGMDILGKPSCCPLERDKEG